jgi:hypothetical protein
MMILTHTPTTYTSIRRAPPMQSVPMLGTCLNGNWTPNAGNAIAQQRRLPMLWGTFSGRTISSL